MNNNLVRFSEKNNQNLRTISVIRIIFILVFNGSNLKL